MQRPICQQHMHYRNKICAKLQNTKLKNATIITYFKNEVRDFLKFSIKKQRTQRYIIHLMNRLMI